MRALTGVFSSRLLVTAIFRAVDQGVIAIDVQVVNQVTSLDLVVASLWLIGTFDNEIVQDVEQEFRG